MPDFCDDIDAYAALTGDGGLGEPRRDTWDRGAPVMSLRGAQCPFQIAPDRREEKKLPPVAISRPVEAGQKCAAVSDRPPAKP